MTEKHATVKAQVIGEGAGVPRTDGRPSPTAEAIRIELSEAWGDMGAAWGVTPAIARVQAYLMARQEPLTEREVQSAQTTGIVKAPVRARMVVPVQMIPGLVAALQENFRLYQESFALPKGPLH